MASLSPEVREALLQLAEERWNQLLKQLTLYALYRMRGRRWRGRSNGIIPDGHDAQSIASGAIEHLFSGTDWQPRNEPFTAEELEFELKRLVRNAIHMLERRKENVSVTNENDVPHPDEEFADEDFFNNFPGNDVPGDLQTVRKEQVALMQKFQDEFRQFISSEVYIRGIFDCICDGVHKRSDIAAALNISVQEVTNTRKRLDRKLDEFAEQRPNYPQPFIQEMKNV